MPSFYLLEQKVEDQNIWIERYAAPEFYDFSYSEGIPAPTQMQTARLFYRYKTKKKTDYLPGIFTFPAISNKFQDLLQRNFSDPLEFLPLELICEPTGEIDRSYRFLNILDNVSCFDWERSEYEILPASKMPCDVAKLAVVADSLSGRDIARMAEIRSLILVSERLREAVEEEGLTGVGFRSIESYSEFEL